MNGWEKNDIFINGYLHAEIIDLSKTTINKGKDVVVQLHVQMMIELRIQIELEAKRLNLELKHIDLESKSLISKNSK